MEKLRLTEFEIDGILQVAKHVFGNALACVRLHGSRTDLSKRGGDIDLIFEVIGAVVDRFALTRDLRQGLCTRLGDQKFDIFIISQNASLNSERENSFYELIHEKSKILWGVE